MPPPRRLLPFASQVLLWEPPQRRFFPTAQSEQADDDALLTRASLLLRRHVGAASADTDVNEALYVSAQATRLRVSSTLYQAHATGVLDTVSSDRLLVIPGRAERAPERQRPLRLP